MIHDIVKQFAEFIFLLAINHLLLRLSLFPDFFFVILQHFANDETNKEEK